jgi:hypothetical protein
MTTTTRQNDLILNEDWTRIYQTFKNADFKSYDFENLRRVIITYIRENYPEDFNDYIESSEYMALIDAMAFLGQSLSFRIDLASRENFLELAERKASVLRIAQMLSYKPKRNNAASGLLKFTSITTSEEILDSNGKNLAQQLITWNDPTNSNWYEQFILVLNSAMTPNTEFGRSQGTATIGGVTTDQYRFNTITTDVPIYSYTKSVAGRTMAFEIVSTSFKNSESIYEEQPLAGNQLGFVYRNDGSGPSSTDSGFFLMFKQGSLELADFTIDVPTTNEKVAVDTANINNDDIWLFGLSSTGAQTNQWAQVANLVGNNIAYNSISRSVRNIFSVTTKENDAVDLIFADGVYGNLPQGKFRLFYRVSNGLTYSVAPTEMSGINIAVPYVNAAGAAHTVTIGLALQSTVSNASATESVDSIRTNAPATYYTQNRMITGEDYNLAPLASSQDILKIKAVNRTSSGISRNFEIIDVSGKYSSVNVFADDGFIYKETTERALSFKFSNKLDIINFIRKSVEPALAGTDVYNFYLTKFAKKTFDTVSPTTWVLKTSDVNLSTGYFLGTKIERVGLAYGTGNMAYISYGAMVKFTPVAGKAFKNGNMVDIDPNDPTQTDRIWAKVIRVVGDGSNGGVGVLANGMGTISVNDVIPEGSILTQVVPKLVNDLPVALETEMVNLAFQNLNFGLRYSVDDAAWHVVSASNIDLTRNFSQANSGNTTNTNVDASWVIAFVKDADSYSVRIRALDYVFGSIAQNRFYFDSHEKRYNDQVGKVVKDTIKILGINTAGDATTQLKSDIPFEINDVVQYDDGYESNVEVKLAFSDSDSDGVIDNPDAFEMIVGGDSIYTFAKQITDANGNLVYEAVNTLITPIVVLPTYVGIDLTKYANKQLLYFYSPTENNFKSVHVDDQNNRSLTAEPLYKATRASNYLFFKEVKDGAGSIVFELVDVKAEPILVFETENNFQFTKTESGVVSNLYSDGQLIYFYTEAEDYVKRVDNTTYTLKMESTYKANIGRSGLKFQYLHNASSNRRIDPSVSNIMDISIMTRAYDEAFRTYLAGGSTIEPTPPSSDMLRINFGSKLNAIKSISDEIIYHPVKYKILFGATADPKLQGQFKVVKNPNKTINDNDLKVRIITAINTFFNIAYWDFGDRFFLTELTTYVLNTVSPDISNIVLVPRQTDQVFGSLFEIQSKHDEILISGATVDNIDIVTAISATEVRAASTAITTTTN